MPSNATPIEEIRLVRISPSIGSRILSRFHKAGTECSAAGPSSSPYPPNSGASSASKDASGALCAGQGFWVAVLPLKYSGSHADLAALVDGLTEDIVTGLSH